MLQLHASKVKGLNQPPYTGGGWLRLYTIYFHIITGRLLSEYWQFIGLMPLMPNSLATQRASYKF